MNVFICRFLAFFVASAMVTEFVFSIYRHDADGWLILNVAILAVAVGIRKVQP